MKEKRILVFGGGGNLGSSLCPYLKIIGNNVKTIGRNESNDFVIKTYSMRSIENVVKNYRPNTIINLAAETNVDKCEILVEHATKANTILPSLINTTIKNHGSDSIHLIQISTDQVYDGTGNHIEEIVCPVNVYGLTKLAGEMALDSRWTTILRVNFFGRSMDEKKESFSDWIVNSLRQQKKITLFNDVKFNAIHKSTLCKIIDNFINTKLTGIFNLGSINGISKYEFAVNIANLLNLSIKSASIGKLSDSSQLVRRPINMTMNIDRVKKTIIFDAPFIEDEIIKTAKEYNE